MQQEIIKQDHTLDRPCVRVRAEEVFEAMVALSMPHDDAPVPHKMTTRDITAELLQSGKCRGLSESAVERSVRVAVSWLVARDLAYVAGETSIKERGKAESRPFLYSLRGAKYNWSKGARGRVVECDHARLLRAFCGA